MPFRFAGLHIEYFISILIRSSRPSSIRLPSMNYSSNQRRSTLIRIQSLEPAPFSAVETRRRRVAFDVVVMDATPSAVIGTQKRPTKVAVKNFP